MKPLPLNPLRQARLELAIWAAIDARDDGDPVVYRHALEHLAELHHRLRTEELAEQGYLPRSLEECVFVLDLATEIIEAAARTGVMRV
jgi:hypothetical protein